MNAVDNFAEDTGLEPAHPLRQPVFKTGTVQLRFNLRGCFSWIRTKIAGFRDHLPAD